MSGVNKLRNQFPVDGSTGIVTLTPLTGIEPVIENDVTEDLQLGDVDSTSDNNLEISEESRNNEESKGEDVLLSSNDIKNSVNVASNNFNISSITPPITQNNSVSDNISFDVDPVGKTKIIFVTQTNTVSSGNNLISGGGGNTFNVKVYPTHHKLSRLILAS